MPHTFLHVFGPSIVGREAMDMPVLIPMLKLEVVSLVMLHPCLLGQASVVGAPTSELEAWSSDTDLIRVVGRGSGTSTQEVGATPTSNKKQELWALCLFLLHPLSIPSFLSFVAGLKTTASVVQEE